MIVQWALKGMSLPDDLTARALIDDRRGICCNWWREVTHISPNQVRSRLTDTSLDRHINHFDETNPASGDPVRLETPFISLTAGSVERDVSARTNYVHTALRTALWFGSNFGASATAYVYTCWTILSPRPAVGIEGVSEEVRDLNSYRRYSAYQTEGEIVAKVLVPANQILRCERWSLKSSGHQLDWIHANPSFSPPTVLSNVRGVL